MSTNLKTRLAALVAGPKSTKDKLELGRKVLSARFLSEIQQHLDLLEMPRKDFAKKMGVSESFISQLYTGEKVVSMDFLAKVQETMGMKFYVSTIDQIGMETIVDKVSEKVFSEIIKLEKQKKSLSEEDGGFWVYHSTKKPNYEQPDREIIELSNLAVA